MLKSITGNKSNKFLAYYINKHRCAHIQYEKLRYACRPTPLKLMQHDIRNFRLWHKAVPMTVPRCHVVL